MGFQKQELADFLVSLLEYERKFIGDMLDGADEAISATDKEKEPVVYDVLAEEQLTLSTIENDIVRIIRVTRELLNAGGQ